MYFGQGGELNAVRWNDWKVNFAGVEGNITTGSTAEHNSYTHTTQPYGGSASWNRGQGGTATSASGKSRSWSKISVL
jgi:hypothetical protein